MLVFLIPRPVKVPPGTTDPVRELSNSTYAIYPIHCPLQLLLACLMLGTEVLGMGINGSASSHCRKHPAQASDGACMCVPKYRLVRNMFWVLL